MINTEKLAADIFALAVSRSSDLAVFTANERSEMLTTAAELCFEAAAAFMAVKAKIKVDTPVEPV